MYLKFENLKNKKFIMAGPNVIESEEQVLMMATKLKNIFSKYNVNFIFKTSFDKANRTSASSYRGLGFNEGLRILKKVKDEIKIPIITDIHESWQAGPVGEIVDVIQIPAFLCRQTDLLKAAAETGKIIQIKKGQFCSADVVHKSKEKIIEYGNPNVILCERGNSFGYQDLIVDPRNLIWLKSNTSLTTNISFYFIICPCNKNNSINAFLRCSYENCTNVIFGNKFYFYSCVTQQKICSSLQSCRCCCRSFSFIH